MFVRTKLIKGNNYAYLVENTWTLKGSRQKTVAYLGKVCELEKARDIAFEEYIKKQYLQDIDSYLEKSNPKSIIYDLLSCELMKHGFTETLTKHVVIKEHLVSDLIKLKFFKNSNIEANMEIVLKLNHEYMCPFTIKRLLELNLDCDEETAGRKLAEHIVSAGISLDPEIFIALFEKVYQNEKLVIV